jgi:hypothetical protein
MLTEGIFDTKTKGYSLPRCPFTCRDNYCRRASMPHYRSDLQIENGEVVKEGRWPSNSTSCQQRHDIDHSESSITPERQTPKCSTTDRKSCIVESVQSRDRRQGIQRCGPGAEHMVALSCACLAIRGVRSSSLSVSSEVGFRRRQMRLVGSLQLPALSNGNRCGEREPCVQS